MKSLLLSAAIGLASMSAAWAQTVTTAQDFVNQAASGGLFEVQSSELALERSQNATVDEFAKQMVADHTPNNEKLAALVQAEGLIMPAQLAEPHAAMMQELDAAQGDAFDPVYGKNQIAAHWAAVALYKGFAEGGDNAALKGYAQESLPVLEQHLEHAQGLVSK